MQCYASIQPIQPSFPGGLLRDFLHSYLPDDAHERCSNVCHVAVTRFFPYVERQSVSEFKDK